MPRAVGPAAAAYEGPQTFAGAEPGTEVLDAVLVERNKAIEADLLATADSYYASEDLRWFFTYAHGMITHHINRNLSLFQRPNALMRLNIHFAEEFVRALAGQPHRSWQWAFRRCAALGRASQKTMFLIGEAEACGAAMAKVHIDVDLSNALKEVGCVPPADFGNMFVFVNWGSLAALARLRGDAVGAGEAIAQHIGAPFVDLEVKAWRNVVYESACNVQVPEVAPDFSEGTR